MSQVQVFLLSSGNLHEKGDSLKSTPPRQKLKVQTITVNIDLSNLHYHTYINPSDPDICV